jgi:hypothetical protein
MDINVLIRMADQIEKNMPFAGDKAELIAAHMVKFWTPVMRADLYKEVSSRPADFSPVLNNVVEILHAQANAVLPYGGLKGSTEA